MTRHTDSLYAQIATLQLNAQYREQRITSLTARALMAETAMWAMYHEVGAAGIKHASDDKLIAELRAEVAALRKAIEAWETRGHQATEEKLAGLLDKLKVEMKARQVAEERLEEGERKGRGKGRRMSASF